MAAGRVLATTPFSIFEHTVRNSAKVRSEFDVRSSPVRGHLAGGSVSAEGEATILAFLEALHSFEVPDLAKALSVFADDSERVHATV
jgi:hypothetical protein